MRLSTQKKTVGKLILSLISTRKLAVFIFAGLTGFKLLAPAQLESYLCLLQYLSHGISTGHMAFKLPDQLQLVSSYYIANLMA